MVTAEDYRIERDKYVTDMLVKKDGFTREFAVKAWENSRTRKKIEGAKDMVCQDGLDLIIQDNLIFMEPENAYMQMGFEMTGSSAWMDNIL